MAVVRFVKRRLGFVGVVLIATTLWIFYLIVSAPAASDGKYENALMQHNGQDMMQNSVTRRVMLPPPDINAPQKPGEKQIRPPPQIIAKEVEVSDKQKIPRPPPERVEDVEKVRVFGDQNKAADADSGFKNPAGVFKDSENPNDNEPQIKPPIPPVNNENSKDTDNVQNSKDAQSNVASKAEDPASEKGNETKQTGNETVNQNPVLKGVEQKVIAIGETVKNKTLEKLADFGVIQKKEYQKLIYEHTKWSLNLSIEDIGNIMKDTEYFQKKQNLTEMEYQPLLQPNSNVSKVIDVSNIEYGLGYCDCKDLSCLCCVRIFNKRMRLNSTACATIMFTSKSQELQYEFSVNKKPYFATKIAAEFPPKICLESEGKAAGLCTLFSNVTAKVNIENETHKIHLSGCMEFDLTLYNRTIGAFPVGCFKIPGSSSEEKENNAHNMGNFMP